MESFFLMIECWPPISENDFSNVGENLHSHVRIDERCQMRDAGGAMYVRISDKANAAIEFLMFVRLQ